MENTSSKYSFFNRELSWIEFNARVLTESFSEEVPLLERLTFLGIVASNFDEFFMVRVAGLKQQAKKNPEWQDISGLTAKVQLEKIAARVHELVASQYCHLQHTILPELKKRGIEYLAPHQYSGQDKLFLENLFQEEIFPLLTPLRIDSTESFPHVANLRLHAAFLLKKMFETSSIPNQFTGTVDNQPLAIVQIPTSIKRVVYLPAEKGMYKFTVLDDIIRTFGTLLFPGYTVEETLLFKVTRDADFAVDEDREDDFIQAMEEVLERRQSSFAVRMTCTADSPKITEILRERLNLLDQDLYIVADLIDPATLIDLNNIEGFAELKNPLWKHFWPHLLPEDEPLWDKIAHKDILLFVPYQSYDPVINILNSSIEDQNVLAIKMTLYRTSNNSPILHALEKAARKGKQVTVFMEVKARFDEQQNISWAERLERSGVIIVHGIANLKVHAKILLIVRRETDGIRRYVHLSTGNYNEKTARMYADLSLFTGNIKIAQDATIFFNMISGYSAIQTLKHLIMAPLNLRSQLLSFIEREIKCSTPDRHGLIIAKMNSLADEQIITALYKASCAGVKISLQVRGICMLVPGVKNQSENIEVVSIIDRFLEHSRIYYFQNGGAQEMYLSSADLMTRNLDKRVELMFPILQVDMQKYVLDILHIYFQDNTKSHYLQSNGVWEKKKTADNEKRYRAQEIFYTKIKHLAEAQTKIIPTEFTVRRK